MAFFQKNWLKFAFGFLVILILIFTLMIVGGKKPASSTPVANKTTAGIKTQIEKMLVANDPNFKTNTGVLPTSKFYFLKIWGEKIVGLGKSGNNKLAYEIKLEQKRLAEVYLLFNQGKMNLADKSLKEYLSIAKQIDTQNTAKYAVEVTRNYTTLSLLSMINTKGESRLLEQARQLSFQIAMKNAPKEVKK